MRRKFDLNGNSWENLRWFDKNFVRKLLSKVFCEFLSLARRWSIKISMTHFNKDLWNLKESFKIVSMSRSSKPHSTNFHHFPKIVCQKAESRVETPPEGWILLLPTPTTTFFGRQISYLARISFSSKQNSFSYS